MKGNRQLLSISAGILLVAVLVACTSALSRTVALDHVFGLGTVEDPHVGNFLELIDPEMLPQQESEEPRPDRDSFTGSFPNVVSIPGPQDLVLSHAVIDLISSSQLILERASSTGIEFPSGFTITGVSARIEISDELHAVEYGGFLATELIYVMSDDTCEDEGTECKIYRAQSNGELVIVSASFSGQDLTRLHQILALGDEHNTFYSELQFYGTFQGLSENGAEHFSLQPSYYDRSTLTFSLR